MITKARLKVELVRIGNSRGIRIPKPIIEQCGFGDIVDVRVEQDCLIIASTRRPRQGWREAFRAAGDRQDGKLILDPLQPNEFDQAEWKW